MNTTLPYSSSPTSTHPMGWLSRVEAWLDSKGKAAWIAAMVLGFIFFWPVGLALLAYLIWSKPMFSKSCRARSMTRHVSTVMTSSGNSAFDNYKADTLRRLEEEQHGFEAFLQRLREAKDKAEFDDFMEDRARAAATETTAAPRDETPRREV